MDITGGIIQSILGVVAMTWWIFLPIILADIFLNLWLKYIRGRYLKGLSWVLLEVKMPKEVLMTPKAMESVFSALHGTYSFGHKFLAKYWEGKVEDWTAFEMIGDSGSIRFFVRTQDKYRNLVEAAIYAQYSNAEITIADDYLATLPGVLPNKIFDIYGADFILAKDNAYPIKTYEFFEEVTEEKRLDPIANIAEVMAKLKDGEKAWYQVLIRPIGDELKKEGDELVDKLMGVKKPKKESIWIHVGIFVKNLVMAPFEHPVWPEEGKKDEKPAPSLSSFSPGKQDVIKAIEKKTAKIAFAAHIRFLYIDHRASFTRSNVAAMVGAIRQFNTQNLNSFKVDSATGGKFPFKAQTEYLSKLEFFDTYKKSKMNKKASYLNSEELATIYHYPSKFAAAPSMQRVEFKKGEPPSSLPVQ